MTTSWIAQLPANRLIAEISLWSSDLSRMADDMQRIEPYADIYHIDASDGHFTPAFLMFPDQVAAIRKLTKKPLHVHLMAHESIVMSQIEQFADAGADLISVHVENSNATETVSAINNRGLQAGLALCVETDVSVIASQLEHLSFITLLGTRIGVKGQGLDDSALQRMQQARKIIDDRATEHRVILAADGGIRDHTVPDLRSHGADTIVMGSLAFNEADVPARMQWVHDQPAY